MNLNVGCWQSTYGDVRVDVARNSNANLIADMSYLPFRDKVFDEVMAFHVLEHLKDPKRGFDESRRVGRVLHARFPYKHDRVPWILFCVFRLSPSIFRNTFRDWFFDTVTKIGLMDHPLTHRWTILPFGRYQVNKLEVSPWLFLHSGRKEKYFKWLPRIMMKYEWECWI